MKNEIITKNGLYFYLPIHLYLGRKLINRDVSRENLLDFKRILDEKNIQFGLMFGTLLGAVREQNFIEYDEDTDVYVLDENRDDVLSSLFKLRDSGFEVARYDESLLTLIREDDYIDIYFFKKKFFRKRICMQYCYDSKFFNKVENIPFLGTFFNVPHKYLQLLEMLYGKDWRIPKRNAHAEATKIISWKEKYDILLKNMFSYNVHQYNYIFSKQFNQLLGQIKNLKKNDECFLLYGAGTIAELIYREIEDHIVARVDQKSSFMLKNNIKKENIYSPQSIPLIAYDKIIISVLGREKEIITYLTQKLKIPKDRIITFNLKVS